MSAEAVRGERLRFLLPALLALAVSAPSLANGFAYDDQFIIVENARVHDLGRWADWFRTSYWPTQEATLFRPLTTAAFAVQWAVGDGSPVVFHVVSIALAVAGAAAFAWLASLLLPPSAALVVAALFAVHPVHVEAVANIVGQSELSAGLVLMLALGAYIRVRRAGPMRSATTLGLTAAYLLGVLLKEHAVILPALLALAEVTVLRSAGEWRARVRDLTPLYTMLGLVAALALLLRWDVLGALGGEVPHPALMGLAWHERAFVMLGILPEYVRLILWPARLYADYSPELVQVATQPQPLHLNGLLVAASAAILLAVAWRRSPVAALGGLIACLAWLPTSNVLFPSGVLLAERTLYVPSAGILLAVGVAIAWLDVRIPVRRPARAAAGAALSLVLVLAIGKFVDRQRSWRSTADVFHTLVLDAPQSFKAHYSWGGVLFDRGDVRGGEREWLMALRIFPTYHKVYQDLAAQYRQRGLCHAALPLYHRAIEIAGPLPLSRAGIVACLLHRHPVRDAQCPALVGLLDGHDPDWFRARLRSADSALAANDST